MDERQAGQGPTSRRAGLRALPTPTDVEIYVDDAPPLLEVIDELPEPRIADLDALLREVDKLRSSMRRDLSLAATAAEAGDQELAGWLLLGEGGQVRAFEDRALAHLSALEKTAQTAEALPLPRRRQPRLLAAAPLVAAAAAVVGVLTGVVPSVGGAAVTSPRTTNSAMQSYAQLAQLASDGASPSQISAAATKFHAALGPIVASAGSNPEAAEKAIALLQSERAVIAGEADSPALRAVLAQADALVRRLQATLPKQRVRPLVIAPPVVPANDSRHENASARPSSSASAKPTPSPTPSATPSPKPSPSQQSAKPSSSPSDQGPIPHAPGMPH